MTAPSSFMRPPHSLLVEPIVRHALEEDLGRAGDLTSDLTILVNSRSSAKLIARTAGTIAGLVVAQCSYGLVDPTVIIDVKVPDEDRQAMVTYARTQLGVKYGFVSIVSIAFSLLTGSKFEFGIAGQLICSEFFGEAAERGGVTIPMKSSRLMPADVAFFYQARQPLKLVLP